MVDVLLGMLCVLAIIVVGFLILASSAVAVYCILKVIYKLFIEDSNVHGGRR